MVANTHTHTANNNNNNNNKNNAALFQKQIFSFEFIEPNNLVVTGGGGGGGKKKIMNPSPSLPLLPLPHPERDKNSGGIFFCFYCRRIWYFILLWFLPRQEAFRMISKFFYILRMYPIKNQQQKKKKNSIRGKKIFGSLYLYILTMKKNREHFKPNPLL